MLVGVIRVCHVLASVGEKGGLEKNVIELANRQAELGHEVSAIVDDSMAPWFSKRVRIFGHPMDRFRLNPFQLWRLRDRIRESRAEIVHAHANKAAAMVRSLRHGLSGVRRVATVQNIKRSNRPFRDFDAVIAASAQVRESLGPVPATVIWNSIEPPRPGIREAARATNPPFLDDGEPVFSTVGRLVPAKGMDLLLEAMSRVGGFRLWLIGEGVQRPELERLVERLGLGERVWMAGHRDDAVGLMGCSDAFLIASRNEGGPYTLVEALHMRVPCLSTRVGFAPEFLPPEALIDSHSIDALQLGLRRLLADREAHVRHLEPAFRLAAREATLEAMSGKVLELYRSL